MSVNKNFNRTEIVWIRFKACHQGFYVVSTLNGKFSLPTFLIHLQIFCYINFIIQQCLRVLGALVQTTNLSLNTVKRLHRCLFGIKKKLFKHYNI